MKSLLIEEKNKKIEVIAENLAIKVWPHVYRLVNGFIQTMFNTVFRICNLFLLQLGLKKRKNQL